MTKRTLWYVCLGLLCCLALTFVVQAADQVAKKKVPALTVGKASDATHQRTPNAPTAMNNNVRRVAPAASETEAMKAEIESLREQLHNADEATAASIKSRLTPLMDRMAELNGNRPTGNPLDQGGETWALATVIPTTFPYNDTGTLTATDDCVGRPYNDVFYVLTAAEAGAYRFDMCNSTGDNWLTLWKNPTGACTGGTIYTSDDVCGMNPDITINLVAGDVVYVEAGAYSSGSLNPYFFNVQFSPPPPPGGETCASAVAIAGEGAWSNTTCGKIDDYNATCLNSYDGGEDFVYAWTVTTAGNYLVSLTSNASWVGFLVDDACPPDPTTCLFTAMNSGSGAAGMVNLVPGTYYIMIDTWPAPFCIPQFTLTTEIFVAPPGENCAEALPFVIGTTYTGSTVGAFNDYSYNGNTAGDVVYVYTPTVSELDSFQLCGSSYDTYLYIFDTTCDGTPIAFNDDACGVGSILACVPLTGGHTYYIIVDGFSSNTGSYVLNSSTCPPCPPPANDACEAVTPQTLPATFTGTRNCATPDCPSFALGQGNVWIAFTVPWDANITLDYCGSPATGNAWLNLAMGCPCTGFTAGAVWEQTTCAPNITMNWTNIPAGTYYYPVLRDEANGAAGDYTINVSAVPYVPPTGRCCYNNGLDCAVNTEAECAALTGIWTLGIDCTTPCPIPPANDMCVNATPLSGDVWDLAFDVTLANPTAENSFCGMGHDIWYCWETTCEVDVNIRLCGSLYDTKLAVFNTDANCTCPGPTDPGIVCNDDTCGLGSAVSFHALPGKYLVQVGGFSTASGTGVMTIETSAPCQCDPATDVTVYLSASDPTHPWVHYNAPTVDGRYLIYSTTNKNNDGDPRNNDPDFTLEATVVVPAIGPQVWTDPAVVGAYKNYVVVHDCSPLGRCCYGDPQTPSCAVNTLDQCDVLTGSWTRGLDCTTPCPARPVNDDCGNAIVVASLPYTGTGDNTNATLDCQATGWPGEVWYQFTIASEMNVTINLCGTTPVFNTIGIALWTQCPCEAGFILGAYDFTTCGDGNGTIFWEGLAAGSYYYAVYSEAGVAMGPYTINITAAAPPVGRCCYGNPATCAMITEAACTGLSGNWDITLDCTTPCPAFTYCAVTHTSGCDEFIGNVTVAALNNTSDCGVAPYYTDFTGITTNMTAGSSYPITVLNAGAPYATDVVGVWIDWNRNGNFLDAGEETVLTTNNNGADFSGTIVVPAGVTAGDCRMRVRMGYNWTPAPCGATSWGETEDYTVIIP